MKKGKEYLEKINFYKTASKREILESLGIEVFENEGGGLEISHYALSEHFKEYSIDDSTFLDGVTIIRGSAEFRDSKITSLGNLQSIGGNANFRSSQVLFKEIIQKDPKAIKNHKRIFEEITNKIN